MASSLVKVAVFSLVFGGLTVYSHDPPLPWGLADQSRSPLLPMSMFNFNRELIF